MPKDSYTEGQFVGRTKIINDILDWAAIEDPDECRAFSVIGPPGSGKSWVLGRAGQRLEEKGQLVFRLDLSLDAAIGAPKDNATDDAGARVWLRAMIDIARHHCDEAVRPYNYLDETDATLGALAEAVCKKCERTGPVILVVDGWEELPTAQDRGYVEGQIVGRFVRKDCFRFLLARRDEIRIFESLRGTECPQRLDPLIGQPSGDERREQLHKRITERYPALVPVADTIIQLMLNSLSPYQWQHPHLNALLFEVAIQHYQNHQNPLFTKTDLRDCLAEITKPASFTQTHFQLLINLTKLCASPGRDNDFSDADLRALSDDSGYSDLAFKFLANQGMVTAAPSPRNGYQVADEFLGLAQAWLRLP